MRLISRQYIISLSLICISFISLSVSADSSIFADKQSNFFMDSRGIPVKQLMISLGQNYHIPVVVSDQVSGTFVGKLQGMSLLSMLNYLSGEFNLAWYFNGSTLYINSASEVKSTVIVPSYLSAPALYGDIKRSIDLDSPYNKLTLQEASKSIQISGVPQFVNDVESLSSSLDKLLLKKASQKTLVKVFPLRYASAADIDYSYRNQTLKMPGVATQMQQILGSTSGGGAVSKTKGADSSLPKIIADPRQNAVTVMGLASHMQMYASLVHDLDTPQEPINISVSIIDVEEGDLNSLGVQWAASANVGSGKVDFNNASMSSSGGTTAVVNDSNNFLVQINALESKAKAKIVSSPSVLTLNNMPAVLNRDTTFYTKVSSKNSASLQQVSTGELLSVTPHIINGSGGKKNEQMLLTLNIQDGSPSDSTQEVDNLPQTQNSEINTEAQLKYGQSLLIGGFVRDETLTKKNGIPVLGDIPLIGGLFRSTSHTKQHMVRLFLITARPINT